MYKSEELAKRVLQTLAHPDSGAEPQQLIDSITDLATEYSEACARVNRLLGRARDYYSTGNMAESMRIIVDFHVEDDYQNLKYDGLDKRWKEFCLNYGFPVPEPLADHLHQEISGIYQIFEPNGSIAEMLSRLRALSLLRAPLKDRLALIRDLARIDQLNPVWKEMASEYEQARDEEIEYRFNTLPKVAESYPEARALLQELTDLSRCSQPSDRIVKKILAFTNIENLKRQLDALDKTVNAMHDAYREGQREDAERALSEWEDLTRTIPQDKIPPQALETVRPIIVWLNELRAQDAKREVLRERIELFREALEDENNPEGIASAYRYVKQEAENCAEVLPSWIEQEYRSSERKTRLKQWRKLTLILSLALLVCTLLAGVTFWRSSVLKEEKEIKDNIDTLTQMLDEYEGKTKIAGDENGEESDPVLDPDALTRAENFAQQLKSDNPKVANVAAIQELFARIEADKSSEEKRSENFNKARGIAEQNIADEEEVPAGVLKDLQTYGKTQEQRNTTNSITRESANIVRNNQKRRDTQYNQNLNDAKEIVKVLNNTTLPPEQTQELLDQIQGHLDQMEAITREGKVDDRFREAGNAVSDNFDKIKQDFEERKEHDAAFQTITESIGNMPAFLGALKGYANKYRFSPIAADIENSPKCFYSYRDVALWNSFIDKFGRCPADWEKKSGFAVGINEIKEQITSIPDSTKIFGTDDENEIDLIKIVESVNVFGGRAVLAKKLMDDFRSCDEECWVWRQPPKEDNVCHYYYLTKKPEVSSSGEIPYLATRKERGKTEMLPAPVFSQEEINKIVHAPHYAIYQALNRLTENEQYIKNSSEWCEAMISLLNQLDPGKDDFKIFDPVVKVALIHIVAKTLKQDPIFADALSFWEGEILKDPEFDPNTDWIDPENPDLGRKRLVANRILEKLEAKPITEDSIRLFRARAAKEAKTTVSTYTWVGWLNKEGGEWKGILKEEPPVNGELFITVPRKDANTTILVKVGNAVENQVTLFDDTRSFVVGAPILVQTLK